jgi:hypothetical protein
MVVCICLRSIKIFTLKIKLILQDKICHFLKKNCYVKYVSQRYIYIQKKSQKTLLKSMLNPPAMKSTPKGSLFRLFIKKKSSEWNTKLFDY